MMSWAGDAYPFFLLGMRRASERAGALSLSAFIASCVAYGPTLLFIVASFFVSRFYPDRYWAAGIFEPAGLLRVVTFGLFAACFITPFLVAGASDLYFRVDWRANSILLASPLSSRTLLWGKFAILFMMGLPILLALVPPIAVLLLVELPSLAGFFGALILGTAIYSLSCLYLSAFTRRWEAILFWIGLVPVSGLLNGLVRLSFYLVNLALSQIHLRWGGYSLVRSLPSTIPYPQISIWAIASLAALITLAVLIGRGTLEIEKMRSGRIPLGRLSGKGAEEYRKRKLYRWARPEYTHAERATSVRELYIPVDPGRYAPSATDRVFSFLIAIAFLGRSTVLRLINKLPASIRDNPIYIRHTSRYRGFLAGYFEPSGQYKSRVVLALIAPFMLLIYLLFVPGVVNRIIVPAFLLIALISPFDAFVRLARLHRERIAWESILIAPMSGRELIAGTLGVVMAHRLIPLLPWFVLCAIFLGIHELPGFPIQVIALLLSGALYFVSLSVAASISWFVARRMLTSVLLALWGIFYALAAGFVFDYVGPALWSGQSSMALAAVMIVVAIALVLAGIILPYAMGELFDRFARIPFNRQSEEGE